MSIVQEVVTSNHFPIYFEFRKHVVDMYKLLIDKVPLRFNSSFLFHSLFDAYLQQFFCIFLEHVNQRDSMHGIQHKKTSLIFTVCMV